MRWEVMVQSTNEPMSDVASGLFYSQKLLHLCAHCCRLSVCKMSGLPRQTAGCAIEESFTAQQVAYRYVNFGTLFNLRSHQSRG